MDLLLEDEQTQRYGVLVINNAGGLGRSSISREHMRMIAESLSNRLPIRV